MPPHVEVSVAVAYVTKALMVFLQVAQKLSGTVRAVCLAAASKCNEIVSGIITPRAIHLRNQLYLTMKL